MHLRGVTYQWKDPASQGDMAGTYTGMIAQDVEKVFPEWIRDDANGFKTLTVIGFEGIVVEALRELRVEKDGEISGLRSVVSGQQDQISSQQSQNEAQDQEISGLRSELAALKAIICSTNATAAVCVPKK